MQKKIQKIMKVSKKILFPRNNLKYLSLRQQHHLRCFGQVFRPRSLKKELGQFSQKSLTPDMQKNSKNHENRKNYFFLKTT